VKQPGNGTAGLVPLIIRSPPESSSIGTGALLSAPDGKTSNKKKDSVPGASGPPAIRATTCWPWPSRASMNQKLLQAPRQLSCSHPGHQTPASAAAVPARLTASRDCNASGEKLEREKDNRLLSGSSRARRRSSSETNALAIRPAF